MTAATCKLGKLFAPSTSKSVKVEAAATAATQNLKCGAIMDWPHFLTQFFYTQQLLKGTT